MKIKKNGIVHNPYNKSLLAFCFIYRDKILLFRLVSAVMVGLVSGFSPVQVGLLTSVTLR